MLTLRRLPATELMSFSLIQDLNSLTAKAADTPKKREGKVYSQLNTQTPGKKKTP